jgi:hypothetical protein
METRPLFTRRSLLCGLVAALIAAWCAGIYLATHQMEGLFNDFAFYWAGARMLAHGRNPYDVAAMRGILDQVGLHPASALGYSYPLAFAYLMVPLGLLPPLVAGAIFSLVSLTAFGLAVAALFAPLENLSWAELLILAYGAGSFVPVTGSLRMGQVNLLVLLLLALALRGVAPAGSIVAASAIKLYPVVGLLALLPRGRKGLVRLLLGGAAFAALVLVPNLVAGFRPQMLEMFTPDAYYTNESINGFLSRLAGAAWHTAPALAPGLHVEPLMVLVAAVLGMLTFAAVLLTRGRPWAGCLALLLAYAVVAAPRNSLWDFAPILIAMAWCWSLVRARPLLGAVLAAGWALIQVQQTIYDFGPDPQMGRAWLGLLGSTALYGALLLAGLTAFLVFSEARRSGDEALGR